MTTSVENCLEAGELGGCKKCEDGLKVDRGACVACQDDCLGDEPLI